MGMGDNSFRFLLSAKKLGFEGTKICTLGRQFAGMKRPLFDELCETFGNGKAEYPGQAILYADDVLAPAGFTVDSIDASDFEGASIIHDLNLPIPESLRGRYDLVWDGGTLEHVFDFPAALKNAMALLRVGGHLFLETPANNQCGHGFYQFSPELFFRVFTPANGFELVRLYIESGKLFHVVDPIDVHGRVELHRDVGLLMVHAKKVSEAPLSSIQQSDYVDGWKQKESPIDGATKGFLRRHLSLEQINGISKILNKIRMKRHIYRWRRNARITNRAFYIPVTDWNVSSRKQIQDFKSASSAAPHSSRSSQPMPDC